MERCKESVQEQVYEPKFVKQKEATLEREPIAYQSSQNENKESLLEVLLKPEYSSGFIPYQLTNNGKKRG